MTVEATADGSPVPGLPAPENFTHEEPARPRDYAELNAAYVALLAAVVAADRRRGEAARLTTADLLPIGAATFALSKTIAREKIGSWVREPFVEETGGRRRLRGSRLRRAVGELVTCTRCVGAWSALGIVGLRVASPDAGRVVTNVLATAALNDFMQAGFRALCEQANRAAPEQG
jgi:hypothetical protein